MISIYLANKILDHTFGRTTYTGPATLYIALFTTMPLADGSGGIEVTGGSYARVASTNDVTNWPNASAKSKHNANSLTFTQASAAWGVILGGGIYDALTGGNLLVFGQFPSSINVVLNGIVSFDPSQFTSTVS